MYYEDSLIVYFSLSRLRRELLEIALSVAFFTVLRISSLYSNFSITRLFLEKIVSNFSSISITTLRSQCRTKPNTSCSKATSISSNLTSPLWFPIVSSNTGPLKVLQKFFELRPSIFLVFLPRSRHTKHSTCNNAVLELTPSY